MAVPGLPCCSGFSLVAASRGLYSSCSAQSSHCDFLSCFRVWASGHVGFSHGCTGAQMLWLPASRAQANCDSQA